MQIGLILRFAMVLHSQRLLHVCQAKLKQVMQCTRWTRTIVGRFWMQRGNHRLKPLWYRRVHYQTPWRQRPCRRCRSLVFA